MRKKRNVTRKKKAKGFWIAAVVPRVALRLFLQLHYSLPPKYAEGLRRAAPRAGKVKGRHQSADPMYTDRV